MHANSNRAPYGYKRAGLQLNEPARKVCMHIYIHTHTHTHTQAE